MGLRVEAQSRNSYDKGLCRPPMGTARTVKGQRSGFEGVA